MGVSRPFAMRSLLIITAAVVLAAFLFPYLIGLGGSRPTVALLVVDVQNCFLPPNGSLSVPDGQDVIPVINKIRQVYGDRMAVIVG